ncbi:MAG: 4-hydroxy-tetrahydrodipicolinate reductase [Alphaproteobacteria bacterium]|nr:4-hydroxy-tetrahydrodipicolinate reductase [Alphaproteobacteria bacterium]
MTRVAIAGAAGRMGRALVRAAKDAGLSVVAATERPGAPDLGKDAGVLAGLDPLGVPLTDDPAALPACDAFIDFTTPAATRAALAALPPGVAAVIGTTGLGADDEAAIAAAAGARVIVKSGNFSLGVNLLAALVRQAAARLGTDWDIEILETHHRMKVDAPSGTALLLGEAAAEGRGAPLSDLRTPPYDGLTGPRRAGAIGFAVQRGGGVIGEHDVTFATDGEVLRLSHQALDRALFAKGALAAARWATGKPPGVYSMRDVLAL